MRPMNLGTFAIAAAFTAVLAGCPREGADGPMTQAEAQEALADLFPRDERRDARAGRGGAGKAAQRRDDGLGRQHRRERVAARGEARDGERENRSAKAMGTKHGRSLPCEPGWTGWA